MAWSEAPVKGFTEKSGTVPLGHLYHPIAVLMTVKLIQICHDIQGIVDVHGMIDSVFPITNFIEQDLNLEQRVLSLDYSYSMAQPGRSVKGLGHQCSL